MVSRRKKHRDIFLASADASVGPLKSSRSVANRVKSPQEVPKAKRSTLVLLEKSAKWTWEVKNVTITVRRDATVGDLKNACRRKMDICPRLSALVYNCVELKDDVKPLADYGITADCDVYLQLKLQAGTRNASPSAETVIFVMPDMFASGKEGIRDVIRSMNTALPVIPSSHQQCDATSSKTSKQQPWSLEKQMEHELTRNRMKVLTRRRRKANSVTHPSTPDSGSICGAKGHSPVSSSPGSPPNGLVHRKSVMTVKDSSSGPESNVEPKPLAVTAKELTMFFDPPETKQQLMMMRKDLYDPPQNRQELLKLKEDRKKMAAMMCGFCRRRLKAVQQSGKCLCGKFFCTKHRDPKLHCCSVDYKQTDRTKLHKDNPKLKAADRFLIAFDLGHSPSVDMIGRRLLLLLGAALLVHSDDFQFTAANYPTLQGRISLAGLDFFSRIGHRVVDAEIPQIEYPFITLPITGGPGKGYVNVTDLKIPKFESPKFDFKLAPPNGLTWRSRDGVIRVTGKWSAEYTMLFPLNVSDCVAQVMKMDIEIGGGVIPWLVNLFRGPLSTTIRRVIREQFCVTTRTVLLQEANAALLELPTHFSLGKGLFMDYGLLSDPYSTPTYVQGNAYIDVMIGNRTCDLPVVPFKKEEIQNDRMVNVWVSETIPNCLFDSAHAEKLIHFAVNRNMTPELNTLLKTSCHFWEVCLGHFFPDLSQKYPNHYLDLIFRSKTAPWMNVSSDGVELESEFVVDLHISPFSENPDVLAELELYANLTVVPSVLNNRLIGNVTDDQIDLFQVYSKIGDFSPRILSIIKAILRPLIKLSASTVLRVGIPIPTIDNITISGDDARIVLMDSAVRVDTNLEYVDQLY
ncbi:hypothetical protein QR680_014607 [Steinernema hermaphroditum]|uniref:Ubiquitin-like domain-containing protein n=1 Tax=Steinernema hermaphroditum TaxID=289476 RepID=A0AA39IAY9_9BILA|nr:hypothetical protein QR680_014607 [Steinernema hermaphroditum]